MTPRKFQAARRFHALGPRALAELLEELGPVAEAKAEEWGARLTPEMVEAAGGTSFPCAPVEAPKPE